MLNITCTKITSNSDSAGWVQIHDFTPQDENKLKARGQVYVVIAGSKDNEGIDRVNANREFLSRLYAEYFGNLDVTAFNALKTAVEKVTKELGEGIEIAAAVFINDIVYAVVLGGARAEILRENMSAKILDSEPDNRTLASASGYPKAGDVFTLESRNAGGMALKFQESGIPLFKPQAIKILKPVINPKVFLTIGLALTDFIKKKLPKTKVYVRKTQFDEQAGGKKREVTMMVGVILAILLFVSIIFGIRQKNINDNRNKYQARLDQAIHNYDEAVGLFSVDSGEARDLFRQSWIVVNELKSEKVKDDKLEQLVSDLTAKQGQILGEYPTDPKTFVDLSIQTSGFVGTDLTSSGETLFVLDKNSKKIIQIEIATKKTQIAVGPEQIDEALGLASYEDRVFISNSTGVYELGETKKKAVEKDWTGEVLVYAYAGNLYLLDKGDSTIWRYTGGDTGFSAKQNWLGTGVTPDFSLTIALTIDGNIYTLTSSSKILKFSQGSPQNFSTPEEVNLTGAKAIYTNGDLQYFYILNPVEKKIYVLNKNGDYKGAYQSDLISGGSGLVVSEKEKKIIFLADSKLYVIDIQHL